MTTAFRYDTDRWVTTIYTVSTIFYLVGLLICSFKRSSSFPLFLTGSCLSWLGKDLMNSLLHNWIGTLNNNGSSQAALSWLYIVYTLGGVFSSTMITYLLVNGHCWNNLYLFLMGLTVLSTAFIFMTFCDGDSNEFINQAANNNNEKNDYDGDIDNPNNIGNIENTDNTDNRELKHGQPNTYKKALESELVWISSFMLFMYFGSEATFDGWLATFIKDIRQGNDQEMGHSYTGYWLGLTLGRMYSGCILEKVSLLREDIFPIVYIILTIVSILGFWIGPTLKISDSFSLCIGLFMSSLYSTLLFLLGKKFPKHLKHTGMSRSLFIGEFGCSIVPFINGVLTTKYGVGVIGPVTLSLMTTVLVSWIIIIIKRY